MMCHVNALAIKLLVKNVTGLKTFHHSKSSLARTVVSHNLIADRNHNRRSDTEYTLKSYKLNFSMYGAENPTRVSIPAVDFRSDTVTRPTQEMRQAMFEAEVGDDVMEEDPTVKILEKKVAALCDKEAGLYVSSGTMGNLVAIMAHTAHVRGADIIVGSKCHIVRYEQGGAAQIGGVTLNVVPNNPDGTFDIDEMLTQIHEGEHDVHYPVTALICVENTHNACGGRILPLSWLSSIVEIGKEKNIPLHMDGARLFNAVVAQGVSAAEITRGFSSVSICLSKGLGAPVGSVLVGSQDFIKKARRIRKVLGGGMRQVGVIAAAGLYAVENNIKRLAEDHYNTLTLANAIAELKSDLVKVNLEVVETNILFIYFDNSQLTPEEFCSRMVKVTEEERNALGDNDVCAVQMFSMDSFSARIVLHSNLTARDVKLAMKKFQFVIKEFMSRTL
ncbi:probable low-specificity L-threonine aldolase 1 isoform X2 [Nilaparvata lugens]|uniref:probable low-specificity L-threonine aldolase 1 isoform X2 n=1 Tax=Nilaparvata lugens TaxID=108931 RepID=UPI000B990255|nr:probable low-specificity L-threonine aldolase 1 isoform X2 [Nilaparvata lugens]